LENLLLTVLGGYSHKRLTMFITYANLNNQVDFKKKALRGVITDRNRVDDPDNLKFD
jgi:hypothetical protein